MLGQARRRLRASRDRGDRLRREVRPLVLDLTDPDVGDRGRGGIVLVGSLACVAGSATLAVYSAVVVNPSRRDPYEVWRKMFRSNGIQTPQVIFECVGANGLMQSLVDSCEFLARVYAAGGWYDAGTIDCTDATHKGMTIRFGGGPHPQDWYGTLDAVAECRLDPSPSIGAIIGLDDVPEALDQVRRSQGPPRIVVHPQEV